jgi:hypothetical protein
LVVASNVVTVEVAPLGKIPQLEDSHARFVILPELSMIIRMLGVATASMNGGVDV